MTRRKGAGKSEHVSPSALSHQTTTVISGSLAAPRQWGVCVISEIILGKRGNWLLSELSVNGDFNCMLIGHNKYFKLITSPSL